MFVQACSPHTCECMCMKEGVYVGGASSKESEGVKRRSAGGGGCGGVVGWGGSYLAGCKKMPPGLLMEETGISSETSIVPACH